MLFENGQRNALHNYYGIMKYAASTYQVFLFISRALVPLLPEIERGRCLSFKVHQSGALNFVNNDVFDSVCAILWFEKVFKCLQSRKLLGIRLLN